MQYSCNWPMIRTIAVSDIECQQIVAAMHHAVDLEPHSELVTPTCSHVLLHIDNELVGRAVSLFWLERSHTHPVAVMY